MLCTRISHGLCGHFITSLSPYLFSDCSPRSHAFTWRDTCMDCLGLTPKWERPLVPVFHVPTPLQCREQMVFLWSRNIDNCINNNRALPMTDSSCITLAEPGWPPWWLLLCPSRYLLSLTCFCCLALVNLLTKLERVTFICFAHYLVDILATLCPAESRWPVSND